jgi:hypothetical protein
MNWRRGFFRLWLVAALLWLLAIGFILHVDIRQNVQTLSVQDCSLSEMEAEEEARRAGLPEGFKLVTGEACLELHEEAKEYLGWSGALVLGPPIGVLGLGFVAFWVAGGFRRT